MQSTSPDPRRELVERGYDATAEAFARLRRHGAEQTYLVRVLDLLPPRAHVLDLGCGNGEPIARQVLDQDFRLTGVDISAEQVRRACAHLPAGQFIRADLCDVDLPNAGFDAAIAWDSLFHVPRELHFSVFQRIHRWLTRDAPFLLSLGGSAGEFTADHLGAPMFYSAHAPEKALELLRHAGFDILLCEMDDPTDRGHLVILAQRGP